MTTHLRHYVGWFFLMWFPTLSTTCFTLLVCGVALAEKVSDKDDSWISKVGATQRGTRFRGSLKVFLVQIAVTGSQPSIH